MVPQFGPTGQVTGWAGTLTDTHESRRAVEEREFLAEASRVFAESMDLRTTLNNVAKLMNPRFADWCQIDFKKSNTRLITKMPPTPFFIR